MLCRLPLFAVTTLAIGLGLGAPAAAQTLPVADPGEDQLLACEGTDGAQVTLDGSGSFDPDDPNTPLAYTWTGSFLGEGVELDGAVQLLEVPAGIWDFSLVVEDLDGESLPEEVQVTVGDGSAPVIQLGTTSATMWPPNHKYHAFTAAGFVDSAVDACGAELPTDRIRFARVSSDEPDNSNGDGNTTEDIQYGYGCSAVLLRSERRGPGDGRVYQGTLGVADASGVEGEAVVTVSVPKSQGKNKEAVDSGEAWALDATPEACQIVDLCPPVPSPLCEANDDRAKLSISERRNSERLRFRAKGFAVSAEELGDGETGTDYQLCIYVDDGVVAAVEGDPSAPSGEGWSSSARGQSYRARGPKGDSGIKRLAMRSRGGETSVRAKGEGVDVALPLPDGASVIVQLHGSDGSCLETTFDGEPRVNTELRYKAKARR